MHSIDFSKIYSLILPYQPLDVKPLPLRQTDADEYILALKQELRGCMRELPYFIKTSVKTKGEKNSIFLINMRQDEVNLRSDWLPKQAHLEYQVGLRRKNSLSGRIINPLLSKLNRSRWLDIGLVLFLHFY